MARQPRASAAEDHQVRAFLTACDDTFTQNFFRNALFDSQADARRAWPAARRLVWARSRRLTVPRAAKVFDGLSLDSADAARWGFHHVQFPAGLCLAAVARDRAALDDFCRREPRPARELADFLDILRADLDVIERQARQMPAALSERPYPPHVWPAGTYGGQHQDDAA